MSPQATRFFYFLLSPVLGKKGFQSFFELLYLFSLAGMNYGQVIPQKSGEVNILKFVKSYLKSNHNIVIFDVGANKGEFTNFALKIFGNNLMIYAIEPLKDAASILRKRFFGSRKIQVSNLGFSNKPGKTFIYFDESSSELASLYKRTFKAMSLPVKLDKRQQVSLITLDQFCARNKIQYIDLLKIDAEGNELKILQGSRRMIKESRVRFIQFEFGGTMIDSRTFFRDIFRLLDPNFKIYRILQDGVRAIDKYSEKQEIFIIGNFLAISRNFKL